jgi:hypothetical protein
MNIRNFCPFCGEKFEKPSAFCSNCGKKLIVEEPENSNKPEKIEQETPDIPQQTTVTVEYQQENDDNIETAGNNDEESKEDELSEIKEIQTESGHESQVTENESPTLAKMPEQPDPEQEEQTTDTEELQIQPQPQPQIQQQPAHQTPPHYYQQQMAQTPKQTEKKKKFPWFFTIFWGIMLLAVAAWGYFLFFNNNYDKPEITEDTLRVVLYVMSAAAVIYTLTLKLTIKKYKAIPVIVLILFALVIFYNFCMIELIEGDWLHDTISDITNSILGD